MSKNAESKICQNCKKEFIIDSEDFNFYEKIEVPPPTFCPECRAIRRMTWRNERSLFYRNCDFSGDKIITMFHPDASVIVYDRDIWWGDEWDPTEYGVDYNFNKSFFEQYKELLSKVPLASLGNTNVINSPYGNHNADCKNCYLVYASFLNENVSYSQGASDLKDCIDTYSILKSEQCYEDVLCGSLYQTHFSYDSDESLNSWFLKSCVNCHDCIGCMNLRNKKYCVFNQQYSKEDYLRIKEKLNFGSYKNLTDFKNKYKNFILKMPHRYACIIKSFNATGDNILNSKNVKNSFDIYGDMEDCKFVAHGLNAKDSYDCYGFSGGAHLLYEGVDMGIKGSNNFFSILNHGSFDTHYTYMCYNSKNLFGCIGIRKGEYCILNKRYTKEQYEELVPKIIQHMSDMPYIDSKGRIYKYGEFFPPELSPFCYNETIAQEYFPLTKEQALEQGYKWKDKEKRNYEIDIYNKDIPDNIKDVKEDIIGKVIECEHKGTCNEQCTEAFKIIESELQFYKRMNLPLPHLCPNCRHYQRLKQRNPLKLWHRQCMCNKTNHYNHEGQCEVEFETSYAPDRPEIIYCKKCYQQEVY